MYRNNRSRQRCKIHTSDRVSRNAVRRKIMKCVWEAQNTLRRVRTRARTFQLELERERASERSTFRVNIQM
jgi:hypothetical protein